MTLKRDALYALVRCAYTSRRHDRPILRRLLGLLAPIIDRSVLGSAYRNLLEGGPVVAICERALVRPWLPLMTDSAILLLFNFTCGEVELYTRRQYFGGADPVRVPLGTQQAIPAEPRNVLAPPELAPLVMHMTNRVQTGLRALENLQRNREELFVSATEAEIAAALEEQVAQFAGLQRSVQAVSEALRPALFASRHDVYAFGIVADSCLVAGVPVVRVGNHFGLARTRYEEPAASADIASIASPYRADVERAIGRILLDDRDGADERTDLLDSTSLPYMRASFSPSPTSEVHQEFERMRKELGFVGPELRDGISVYGRSMPDSLREGACRWLVVLHSFADAACIYGFDGFSSHFGYFEEIVTGIVDRFPDDEVLIRPHPNVLLRQEPKERWHSVRRKDYELTWSFMERLSALSDRVLLSDPNQPMAGIIAAPDLGVVTRWGTVSCEAVLSGTPFMVTSIAPIVPLGSWPDTAEDDVVTIVHGGAVADALDRQRAKVRRRWGGVAHADVPAERKARARAALTFARRSLGGVDRRRVETSDIREAIDALDERHGQVTAGADPGMTQELATRYFRFVDAHAEDDLARSLLRANVDPLRI